jgi:hypothetical protein
MRTGDWSCALAKSDPANVEGYFLSPSERFSCGGRAMKNVYSAIDVTDRGLTKWMARYGVTLLRLSAGVVFFVVWRTEIHSGSESSAGACQ